MENFFEVALQLIKTSDCTVREVALQIREYLYSGEYPLEASTCCDDDISPFEAFVREARCA
jgi:hypothetical protein